MLINSRAVALLLSASVCIVTVAFLSLVDGTNAIALLVAGVMSFCSTFLLSYFTLEFLIFREINKVYASLDDIQQKELQTFTDTDASNLSANPIVRIKEEIVNYADKKQKEIDKLKKLEAYRKEFLANVSHELKTPIFAAQGYILTLLDGAMEDDKVKYKFLKKAAKSLNGLDALVADLLTLSQIESGVIIMQNEIFDIKLLTQDVFEQLESKAAKRNIKLTLESKREGVVNVNADYNRINQVLTNLINNAIKYNRPKGWVKVQFNELPSSSRIEVVVTDNGPGIAKEHLDRVFERFYRVDKSRSKKQGGTGLGLAIVKHILEGHKSKITVQSELNKGTTFRFSLEKGVLPNEKQPT